MAIRLDSGFEIVRFSDLAYEDMTVEIQYKGEQIAQINRDQGAHMLEIEILADYIDPNFMPRFMLDDFLFALNEAKRILKEQ